LLSFVFYILLNLAPRQLQSIFIPESGFYFQITTNIAVFVSHLTFTLPSLVNSNNYPLF